MRPFRDIDARSDRITGLFAIGNLFGQVLFDGAGVVLCLVYCQAYTLILIRYQQAVFTLGLTLPRKRKISVSCRALTSSRAGAVWLTMALAAFTILPAPAADDAPTAAKEETPATPAAPALDLKKFKTPFGPPKASNQADQSIDELSELSLNGTPGVPTGRTSLRERLVAGPRLYLPSKMILGRTSEFTVKGKPGYWVAIAMADKDKGAKPIFGHAIRLGPDRKVVAGGQIPASGVLVLNVECPVEGDLIDEHLYFEAALWCKDDFSDTQIAQTIPSETAESAVNAVLIAGEPTQKFHRIHIAPDGSNPLSQRASSGMDSGRP